MIFKLLRRSQVLEDARYHECECLGSVNKSLKSLSKMNLKNGQITMMHNYGRTCQNSCYYFNFIFLRVQNVRNEKQTLTDKKNSKQTMIFLSTSSKRRMNSQLVCNNYICILSMHFSFMNHVSKYYLKLTIKLKSHVQYKGLYFGVHILNFVLNISP